MLIAVVTDFNFYLTSGDCGEICLTKKNTHTNLFIYLFICLKFREIAVIKPLVLEDEN